MTAPLSGLKILDFSTLLPGPCATMMLADMGAEVLRVESPSRIDLLRVVPPMIGKVSAGHAYLNRSKRSVALDLKNPEAREVIASLIKDYDIVVEQFRPGVMDKLGFGYEQLKQMNPGVIYCSITGYGQSGPYKNRAGHDINYLALAGISSYSGRRNSGPPALGVQMADVAGGSHHAVMGILAAVIQRMNSGHGTHLDVSMCDAAFTMNHMAMAAHLATGKDPEPEDSPLNGAGGYDYFETADGRYVSVGALEPQFVKMLCQKLEIDDLSSLMLSQNPQHCLAVKSALKEAFRQQPLVHWEQVFADVDACVEPVLTLSESMRHPHFEERGMICEVMDCDGNPHAQLASPIRFSGVRYSPLHTGAELGEHTRQVLRECGYTEEKIASMNANGVFGKNTQITLILVGKTVPATSPGTVGFSSSLIFHRV
ncbi:CaiB/BaiF CoA transferase family protein [Hahella ganghwensis]|uniref:CaiB/BaiF CoA transferase family protein n=1 Tax=Hahella ganghwensis TaxID=286420 RepID=UPI00037CC14F|nr:CaiB/BaiF CoA-transferase family protein [Hahella ganghwensis]